MKNTTSNEKYTVWDSQKIRHYMGKMSELEKECNGNTERDKDSKMSKATSRLWDMFTLVTGLTRNGGHRGGQGGRKYI